MTTNAYKKFTDKLEILISRNPDLITMTLSNIFTMRLIGNKTHGDLGEIAIVEFINQYMDDCGYGIKTDGIMRYLVHYLSIRIRELTSALNYI